MTKSRKAVGRKIQALSQKKEHRSLLRGYTFPIKNDLKKQREKHQTPLMPDTGPCLQQCKVRTLPCTVLELSTGSEFHSSLCAWIGLFIYHK